MILNLVAGWSTTYQTEYTSTSGETIYLIGKVHKLNHEIDNLLKKLKEIE